jgi:hypothetical protein
MANVSILTVYGSASIVLNRGTKPTDSMAVIQLSKLTSKRMESLQIRLDRNEPKDSRVLLILRKKKARYTLKKGADLMIP